MQAFWVYSDGPLRKRHTSSSHSGSLRSSVPGSPEPISQLEVISRASSEREEKNVESPSQQAASDDHSHTNRSSRASSLRSNEGIPESEDDQDSTHISDEQHSDPTESDNAVSLDNVYLQPARGGEYTLTHASNRGFPTVEQTYTGLLGLLKTDFYNRKTISDDHSGGSKIEERSLLALRGREDMAQENKARLPTGNEALQDYQMQLMLLEQENKKKVLKSRQEKRLEIHPSNTVTMGSNAASSASGRLGAQRDDWNEIDEHTIKTDFENVLAGAGPSKLDLQQLQEYIELLQGQVHHFESIQSKQAPPRYQIIYRIERPELVQHHSGKQKLENKYLPYFDHPEWVKGHGSTNLIRCNLPLENLDLYIEKHKDIAFIVYRDFDINSDRIKNNARFEDDTSEEAAYLPRHTNESVRPVNKDLIKTIKALLNSQQDYAQLAIQFSTSLELPAPYLFIYHSRKKLETFQASLSVTAKIQFSLLLEYVTEQYAGEYAAADSLLSRNKISHEYLGYLFKPGDLLVACTDGEYAGFVSESWPKISWNRKVSRMRAAKSKAGGALPLYDPHNAKIGKPTDEIVIHVCDIKVWYWDFDGNFQRQQKYLSLEIPDAELGEIERNLKAEVKAKRTGKKIKIDTAETSILDLNVFPMLFASAKMIDKCRRRGETFWKCRTCAYVSYQGTERDIQNMVRERYMIDLKSYKNLHPENRFPGQELNDELGPDALAQDEPPDDQFKFLLPLKIKGYNLRLKKWFDLMADRISDVAWNEEAFQNLVIDRTARNLIQALVSNQLAAEKGTDLIMGKGNGLILLLHGGPGTGKTLTAEGVAEIAKKPLYRVTCGDVGTKAEDVEKYLESVLHLGKIWGCVVLLDEADVFLEQRSLEDMERNALVSVFLRVLEYYEGILILTSNRVGTFDEAFKSRIQLALHYPQLGPYQRLRIWENFFKRLESFGDDKVDIADLRDHLEDLKEEKMNGRQIRNAITTARQYAEWQGNTLNYKHLGDVIEVSGRFDKYLDRLNGGYTQDQLAEDEGLRLA